MRQWDSASTGEVRRWHLEILKARLALEQPDLVEGISAHGRGLELDVL